MSRARFIWDNLHFDEATLTASAEDANWPVTNLQVDNPNRAYKTGAISAPVTIDIDLDVARQIDSLILSHHNLSTAATVTVRAYMDAARTELEFEEEFDAYQPLFGYGDSGYGEHGYGGYPSPEDLQLFPRLTRAFYFERQNYQYWTIEIDNVNAEFSIGRMFFSYRFEPEVNYSRGHNFELVDNSKVTRSYSGSKFTDVKERYYRVTADFKFLRDGEAYGEMLRLINRYGIRRPFVIHFVPDMGEPDEPYSLIYGRFTRIPRFTSSRLIGRTETQITFEEEI